MTIQLGLLITERCNIACNHCIFSATGESRDEAKTMLIDDICQYIDRIANITVRENTQFSVGFTGGEPFLCFQELLEGIQHAKRMGAYKISTVTNGFWGSNKEDAFRKIAILKQAGLTDISFSMDDFHQVHIPISSLINAVSICKELDIVITIKTVVTKRSRRLAEVLHDLGDLLLGQKVMVEEIPCVPEGRAKFLIPPKDLLYYPGMPAKPCFMGMMLIILPNGDTYPCCGTGWSQQLLLGNTKETNFDTLYDKMKEQPLFMLLREKGPHYFAPYLEANGYSIDHNQYINNCDLCHKVLTHQEFDKVLPSVLHDWRVERVNKMLGSC
ncbi:radical SAM protein [Mobilitalea sibirica]|uniref:Radical SAM protein n=1 Tax=Mobilitalea sibirica TaxID=1462919 RepID=A0A8J7H835_9FIRM|nr:radical SAM/SPASM domain-containing protein [Mobilitalea sibirica]MBH1939950.1 radical SAM protein [Mobilitalea sibirica]